MVMPDPTVIGDATLHCGDCLEVMAGMDADSVDAIVTDPPYFKVKNESWDQQWENPTTFLEWVGRLCEQFERILKPNGSLYFFASPQMAARVECEIAKRFNVLNSIAWRKGAQSLSAVGWCQKTKKEEIRQWIPVTERIIFAEHYGADNMAKGEAGYEAKCDQLRGFVFEPLRAYLAGEWDRAGLTRTDADKATNSFMSGHYMSRVQWTLPTKEKYEQLRAYANRDGGEYLRREYEYLRREYEDLRREYEDLRRPFSVTARDQWADVWDFDPTPAYPGKHPCEKPQPLLCHILKASTRPGAVVFDPFFGSGSLAVACRKLGRRFIGIDSSPEYHALACRRIEAAQRQGMMEFADAS
jgi:adenine-specific DNA-methyltransferase